MPYKFETEKMRIPPDKDRRRKLTPEDKERIKALYKSGITIRGIAKEYKLKCCRRTIQFVLFPERLKKVNFPGKWKKYYSKEYNTIKVREHRNYKYKVLNVESLLKKEN